MEDIDKNKIKKAKDRPARDYDYHGRYDNYNWYDDYYKRLGDDEGLRFNLKLDIPQFDGRMEANDFLDWLNMVEHIFKYYDPPGTKK